MYVSEGRKFMLIPSFECPRPWNLDDVPYRSPTVACHPLLLAVTRVMVMVPMSLLYMLNTYVVRNARTKYVTNVFGRGNCPGSGDNTGGSARVLF